MDNHTNAHARTAPRAWWGGDVGHRPPILDLPPSSDGLELYIIMYLLAVMLSPDDAALRARLIEYHHGRGLEGELQALPNTPISAPEALRLRGLPRFSDIYPSIEMAAYPNVCGEILLSILGEALHDPKVASLERGIKMAGLHLRDKRKGSRRTIYKMWRQYSSVSHLYAAANLFPDDPDGFRFPCGPSTISDFLAAAEKFRVLGETFRPLKGNSSILDPTRTWKVPTDVRLPEVDVVFQLKAGYLTCAK